MRESAFQSRFIKKLRSLFPGIVILKNDALYLQGMLDLTLLFGPRWASIEVKASESSPFQPNQEYYLELLNEMSYAAVVFPSNEDEVLRDLQDVFGYERSRVVEPLEVPLASVQRGKARPHLP